MRNPSMLVPKSSSCTRLRAASSSGVRIRSRSKASSTALCTASIARAKIRGTFFCFNRATTRIDAPKFSPIATITISTLFNGNTDNDCSSVASMTKAVAILSLMESTRLSLISAPIISCPKADSSSANTWP